jgi:hypothetical protein
LPHLAIGMPYTAGLQPTSTGCGHESINETLSDPLDLARGDGLLSVLMKRPRKLVAANPMSLSASVMSFYLVSLVM